MALKNLFSLGALAALLIAPNLVFGQLNVPGPRFLPHESEDHQGGQGEIPCIGDYDAQIFSPFDCTDDDELAPKTGFFFSIDRIYTNISGGGQFSGGAGSNYIWGNRYDLGYMNNDDNGWNLIYEQSEGIQFLNGADILVQFPTLYSAKLGSLEINRVFRQRLSNGSWVEPYVGLRYFNVSDNTLQDFGTGFVTFIDGNRFRQQVTNDAVGMNIGGRLVKRQGRWRTSHDIAIAPTYNQQRFRATDITMVSAVGGFPATTTVLESANSDSSFVPALDYRFEVAYNLSRDFGLRGGANVTYLWDGVARANTATVFNNPNSTFGDPTLPQAGLFDDRLIAAGFSFGFEYRR